uniref:Putative secreted protein n=1 Tax=Anopheles darlingi TaxID=43151 RepID=A0A2M4DAV6_ANODA
MPVMMLLLLLTHPERAVSGCCRSAIPLLDCHRPHHRGYDFRLTSASGVAAVSGHHVADRPRSYRAGCSWTDRHHATVARPRSSQTHPRRCNRDRYRPPHLYPPHNQPNLPRRSPVRSIPASSRCWCWHRTVDKMPQEPVLRQQQLLHRSPLNRHLSRRHDDDGDGDDGDGGGADVGFGRYHFPALSFRLKKMKM